MNLSTQICSNVALNPRQLRAPKSTPIMQHTPSPTDGTWTQTRPGAQKRARSLLERRSAAASKSRHPAVSNSASGFPAGLTAPSTWYQYQSTSTRPKFYLCVKIDTEDFVSGHSVAGHHLSFGNSADPARTCDAARRPSPPGCLPIATTDARACVFRRMADTCPAASRSMPRRLP